MLDGYFLHSPDHARAVIRVVGWVAGLRVDSLRYGSTARSMVTARHVAAWMLRNVTGLSYPGVGLALGSRDHTTILNACRRVDDEIRAGRGNRFDLLLRTIEAMERMR